MHSFALSRLGRLTVRLLLAAGALLAPRLAHADNTFPFRVTFTKYSIDPDADDGPPEPYFIIQGPEGLGQRRVNAPDLCPGGIFTGCGWTGQNVDLGTGTFIDVPVAVGSATVGLTFKMYDEDNEDLFDPDDPMTLTDHGDWASVVFDLRTGQWAGDISYPNNCFQHGPNMLCFSIPAVKDSDGDGLLDDWEMNGVTIDGHFLDFPTWGAKFDHKDIFVELDWVPTFAPTKAVLDEVKRDFSLAPSTATGTPNPDGTPGINLHIDTGGLMETVNGTSVLVGDSLGGGEQLPTPDPRWCGLGDAPSPSDPSFFAQTRNAHFDSARKGIFHYAVNKPTNCNVCNNTPPFIGSGCGTIGGGNMVVTLFLTEARRQNAIELAAGRSAKFAEGTTKFQDAANFMHELGHNLGLDHGGFENHNCKPNYISVMNYFYSGGIPAGTSGSNPTIDFAPFRFAGDTPDARFTMPPLNEAALSETNLFDITGAGVQRAMIFTDGQGVLQTKDLYNTPIDWTGDGTFSATPVSANIDVPPTMPVGAFASCGTATNTPIAAMATNDDWSMIKIPFGVSTQTGGDVGTLPTTGEPNPLGLQALQDVAQCAAGKTAKYVTRLANGDMKYSVTFPARQAYVEVFVRQNGVQNISGNIVGSQVANADGTYTYSRTVPASQHRVGDALGARFYSYVSPGGTTVFTPGPIEQVWLPDYIYGSGPECLPTSTCHPYVTSRVDGGLTFEVHFPAAQAYAEAFVRRNGTQIAAGNIVQSGVRYPDGTYGYRRVVPASMFAAGDQITVRFASNVPSGTTVFTPGATASTWSSAFVYGQVRSLDPACPGVSAGTCTDTRQNQNETGIDCGGVCPACATPVVLPVAVAAAGGGAASPASNAIDGSSSTRYTNDGTLASASISFALASEGVVSKVRLQMYQGSTITYPVQISVDSRVVFQGQTTTSAGFWEQAFPPARGSVVSVRMLGANSAGNNTLSVYEAQILGR
jgi:hypothetical protein